MRIRCTILSLVRSFHLISIINCKLKEVTECSGGSASRPHFAMGVGHPSPQHSASEGLQRNIVNTMAAPDAEVSCEEDDGQIRMTDSALTGQSSCEVGTPSNNASGDSPPSISIVNGNNSRVIMNIDSGNVRSTNTHDSYNDNSTKVQDRTRCKFTIID